MLNELDPLYPLSPNDPLNLLAALHDDLNVSLLYDLNMENVEDPNQFTNGEMIFEASPDLHKNPEQAQDLNEVNNLAEKNVEEHEGEYDLSVPNVRIEQGPKQDLGVDIPDGGFKEEIKIKTPDPLNSNDSPYLFDHLNTVNPLDPFHRLYDLPEENVEDINQLLNGEMLFKANPDVYNPEQAQDLNEFINLEENNVEKPQEDDLSMLNVRIEQGPNLALSVDIPDGILHIKTAHIIRNEKVKLYKCSVCIFSTNYKRVLKRHSLSHLKVKSFTCNVCPYSPNRKENFKTNILKHKSDDENAYKCDKCNFKTIWKGSYTRHIKEHNSLKSSCPYCDFKCSRKYYLRHHVKNKHKNISEPHEVSIKCEETQ